MVKSAWNFEFHLWCPQCKRRMCVVSNYWNWIDYEGLSSAADTKQKNYLLLSSIFCASLLPKTSPSCDIYYYCSSQIPNMFLMVGLIVILRIYYEWQENFNTRIDKHMIYYDLLSWNTSHRWQNNKGIDSMKWNPE